MPGLKEPTAEQLNHCLESSINEMVELQQDGDMQLFVQIPMLYAIALQIIPQAIAGLSICSGAASVLASALAAHRSGPVQRCSDASASAGILVSAVCAWPALLVIQQAISIVLDATCTLSHACIGQQLPLHMDAAALEACWFRQYPAFLKTFAALCPESSLAITSCWELLLHPLLPHCQHQYRSLGADLPLSGFHHVFVFISREEPQDIFTDECLNNCNTLGACHVHGIISHLFTQILFKAYMFSSSGGSNSSKQCFKDLVNSVIWLSHVTCLLENLFAFEWLNGMFKKVLYELLIAPPPNAHPKERMLLHHYILQELKACSMMQIAIAQSKELVQNVQLPSKPLRKLNFLDLRNCTEGFHLYVLLPDYAKGFYAELRLASNLSLKPGTTFFACQSARPIPYVQKDSIH
ncbi:hypothetical protein OE88DRAFT_1647542 [Heliocybe sulcata]|uniref:Uncharacterized protein n=1 Tax=Heliocybe sulcata TaxID=5364 RepID=A0A5C3MSM2_9AGAM|nr:hypothetical protein OE88DRAFT_1647542 [Heliocybe sulcata]